MPVGSRQGLRDRIASKEAEQASRRPSSQAKVTRADAAAAHKQTRRRQTQMEARKHRPQAHTRARHGCLLLVAPQTHATRVTATRRDGGRVGAHLGSGQNARAVVSGCDLSELLIMLQGMIMYNVISH